MDPVVKKAVYLQQTSPNFATFCVTHVQDPNYHFLFHEQQTGERRLYLHLMERSRQKRTRETDNRSAVCTHLHSTNTGGGLFTMHDVTVLWEQLRHGSDSQNVQGPHLPLPFSRRANLRKFMEELLHFAEHPTDSERDRLAASMMHQLPMTETFHRVLSYVFCELLFLLHATRSEEVQGVLRRVGEQALRHLLELFTAHLYAHKQRSHHKTTLYYGGSFEHFGVRMLQLCLRELQQFGVKALSPSFFVLCHDVALTWALDFTQDAAATVGALAHSFQALLKNYTQHAAVATTTAPTLS